MNLFLNQTTQPAKLRRIPPFGISGANLGIAPNGHGWARSSTIARPGASPTAVRRRRSSARSGPKETSALLNGRDRGAAQRHLDSRITDFRATAPPTPPATPDQLFNWTLNLTSGLTDHPDSQVATHQCRRVPSRAPIPGPRPRPDRQGIGPGIQIASDNTLGSFSPHQGRLYVTYVNYVNFKNGPGAGIDNPAYNTDIFLAYSDNGGQSWTNAGRSTTTWRSRTDTLEPAIPQQQHAANRAAAVHAHRRGRPGDRHAGHVVEGRPRRRLAVPFGRLCDCQHRRRRSLSISRSTPTPRKTATDAITSEPSPSAPSRTTRQDSTRPAPWASAPRWGWPFTAGTSIRSGRATSTWPTLTRVMRSSGTRCRSSPGP